MTRNVTALLVGLIVVLAAVGSAGVAFALADTGSHPALQSADGNRTVTVSASGTAEAQPDTAIVRIVVEATDPSANDARMQVAANVSAVKAALADIGIGDANVTTTGYHIYLDRTPILKPSTEPAPPVYRVTHGLAIEIGDVNVAGTVIDTAVSAGATGVQSVQFTVSDATHQRLQNEALADAMAKARRQAGTIADSATLQIVGVHSVVSGGSGVIPVRYATESASGGVPTDVNAGPVTVSASVTVEYDVTS